LISQPRRVSRRKKLDVPDAELIILDGCTFLSSRGNGDVEVDAGQGSSTETCVTSRGGR
jgi:hypothetical protein